MQDIDNLIDRLDHEQHNLHVSDFSKRIVGYMKPWTDLEEMAVSLSLNSQSDDDKTKCLENLWRNFNLLSKEGQGRRRIFIGLLAPNELLDGYSGGMVVTFARMAGVEDKRIAQAIT